MQRFFDRSLHVRARAYALPLVLTILLILMMALLSLFTVVATATHANHDAIMDHRIRLECEGLARVASGELAGLGTPTQAAADAKLRSIESGARADGLDVSLVGELVNTGRVNTMAGGAYSWAGLPFLEQEFVTRLQARRDSQACKGMITQPFGSIAMTQFAMAATTADLSAPCGPEADMPYHGTTYPFAFTPIPPPTGSNYLPTPLTVPIASHIGFGGPTYPQYLIGLNGVPYLDPNSFCPTQTCGYMREGFNCNQQTMKYIGGVPTDATFNPYANPHEKYGFYDGDSQFLIPDAVLAASLRTGGAREIAAVSKYPMMQADIRIFDGEWYVRNDGGPNASWPGTRIWSDHVQDTLIVDGVGPRLYSLYERSAVAGGVYLGDVGVVSYGSRGVEHLYCNDTYVGAPACTSSGWPLPTVAGLGWAEVKDRYSRYDATRRGILGPTVVSQAGQPHDGGLLLPMNLDLAMLATAFATTVRDELGTHLCLKNCGPKRKFNGILAVGGNIYEHPDLSAHLPSEMFMTDGGLERLPSPLQGNVVAGPPLEPRLAGARSVGALAAPQTPVPRINSIRLRNASDLSAFVETGFTIFSGLPVMIEGDFNVTPDSSGEYPAVLIVAPYVAVASRAFDEDIQWLPFDSVTETPTRRTQTVPVTPAPFPSGPFHSGEPLVTVRASVLSAERQEAGTSCPYGPNQGACRTHIQHMIRTHTTGAKIKIIGALGALNSGPDRQVSDVGLSAARLNGDVLWEYPLELTTATVRQATVPPFDRRLPPGTPRVVFPLTGLVSVQ